jgi:adenosylcobinamide-GDP ribazoletransferase
MSGFLTALTFLTRIPAPGFAPERASDLGRAAPWLPVVGIMVGLIVALAAALGSFAGPWVGALLALVAWTAVTGGLHLEALADAADGLGAAHGDPKRFLEVARDPHTGAFGAIAIALQIAAKLVLLAAIAQAAKGDVITIAAPLALTAAWARWGTLVVARATPALGEGLASRLAASVDPRVVVLEGAALAMVSLFVAPVLIAAVPLAFAIALYWRLRIGGVNGDCHGAGIEITETGLLLLLVLA